MALQGAAMAIDGARMMGRLICYAGPTAKALDRREIVFPLKSLNIIHDPV